jgi:hypothetical protein
MRIIQIIIDPAGQTHIETQGFAGASCREASKRLEEAMGIVKSDTPTVELYQQTTSQVAMQQKASG